MMTPENDHGVQLPDVTAAARKAPVGTSVSDPEMVAPSNASEADSSRPNDIHDEETRRTILENAAKTAPQDDIKIALEKMRQDLRQKPHLNLETIAMMLLMGAPKAYAHLKGEQERWQGSQQHLNELGLQYQFGKAGDKAKSDWHDAQNKMELQKAQYALLPHAVQAKQEPIIKQMDARSHELDEIIRNPAYDEKDMANPQVARAKQLRSEIEQLQQAASDIAAGAYRTK
jgi:hypothetical protein